MFEEIFGGKPRRKTRRSRSRRRRSSSKKTARRSRSRSRKSRRRSVKGRSKKRSRSHRGSWIRKPFRKLNAVNKEMFTRKIGYIEEQMGWLASNVEGWTPSFALELTLQRARNAESNVKYATISKILKSLDNVERNHFIKLADKERSDFKKEMTASIKNFTATSNQEKKELIARLNASFKKDMGEIRTDRKNRRQNRMSKRAAAAAQTQLNIAAAEPLIQF
jgi:hypothetical protein